MNFHAHDDPMLYCLFVLFSVEQTGWQISAEVIKQFVES